MRCWPPGAVAGDGPLHRYDADLVVPPLLAAEVAVLKSIAHRYVMADPQRQELQNRQRNLLAELVGALFAAGADALDRGFAELFRDADSDDGTAAGGDRPGVAVHRRSRRSPGTGGVGALQSDPVRDS